MSVSKNTISKTTKLDSVHQLGMVPRPGVNTKGFVYEAKVCALFALRGLMQKGIANFELTQNIKSDLVGNFDDIIFMVEDSNGDKEVFMFQLKHSDSVKQRNQLIKLPELKDPKKKNFYLPPYLEVLKNSPYKNIRYIILTNRNIDKTDIKTFEPCPESFYSPIFNLDGEIFKLKNYGDTKAELLDRLLFMSGQASEENVNQLIEHALLTELKIEKRIVEDVRRKYIEYIDHWISGDYGGFRPLNKSDIILHLVQIAYDSNIVEFNFQAPRTSPEAANHWSIVSRERRRCIIIENFDFTKCGQELSLITEDVRCALKEPTSITNWEAAVSKQALGPFKEVVFNALFKMHMEKPTDNSLTLKDLQDFFTLCQKQDLLLEILRSFINKREDGKKMWTANFSKQEVKELKDLLKKNNAEVNISENWNMDKLYKCLQQTGNYEILIQILTRGLANKTFINDSELEVNLSESEQTVVKELYFKNVLDNNFGNNCEVSVKTLYWYLWHENLFPIILKIEDSSASFFENILQKSSQMYILLSNSSLESTAELIKEASLQPLRHFKELSPETQTSLKNLPMQLQGRTFKLSKVISEELRSSIKTLDIVKLCLGKFNIGSKNYLQPSIFINRTLHKVYVSDAVFKPSVKFIFVSNSIASFKQYLDSNEPNIKFETDVYVISEQTLPSTSSSGQRRLNSTCFNTYNVFLVSDFSGDEIKTALNNRNETDETWYLYYLDNNQTIPDDDNLAQIINVLIVPDNKPTYDFHLFGNIYKPYTFSEIPDSKIPLTCINFVASESESLQIAKRNNDTNFLFYFVSGEAKSARYEFLGSTKHCSHIQIHITESRENVLKIHDLLNYNNCLLIQGEPGMGKTILAEYFTRTASQNLLTVFVFCNSLFDYFKRNNFIENTKLYQHLKLFLNFDCCSNLEKLIFNYFIVNKKVLFVVDGFDEINESVEVQFCDLLKNALRCGLKVILTTRSIKVTQLQKTFLVQPRSIVAFTKTDQIEYLTKFLEIKFNNQTENFHTFVENAIENKLSYAWDTEFAGIALQTHMLSEIFAQEFPNYLNQSERSEFLNKPFDILNLYEKFIDLKISVLKSKDAIGEGSKIEDYFNEVIENCLTEHKYFAIKSIFNKTPSNIDVKFCKIYSSIGLIAKFLENNVPVFVHRTYAEYLCSVYFSENFPYPFVVEIYNAMLENPSYNPIRQLTDRLLANDCPLHLAILNKDVENVEKLISYENCRKTDGAGRCPLQIAMSWGVRQELVRQRDMNNFNFFGRQLNPNLEKSNNSLVLKLYEFNDNVNVQAALEYGIKTMSMRNVNDFLGCVYKKYNSFKQIKDQFVGFYKLNIIENYKQLLYTCCIHNFSFIFKAAVDLKSTNKKLSKITYDNNINLFHLSSYFGANDIVAIILNNKIDVNSIDNDNCNSLYYAVMGNKQNTVELLLGNGADPTLMTSAGQTPYSCALAENFRTIADVIESCANEKYRPKLKANEFLIAVASGSAAKINWLLESGENADQSFEGDHRQTPLIVASLYGNLEAVETLLAAGASVNKTNADGVTALMHACLRGETQIVRRLLQADADVNWKDNDDLTALHWLDACLNNEEACIEIGELLLEHGAVVNCPDNAYTLLMSASEAGNAPFVKWLLSIGVDVNATWDGDTALSLALKYEHEHIANMLKQHMSE